MSAQLPPTRSSVPTQPYPLCHRYNLSRTPSYNVIYELISMTVNQFVDRYKSERATLPDERDCKNARQRDGQLKMSPVTDEVRHQSQKHPRCCPEQFQRGSGNRAVYCWEQLARHYHPDKHCTLNAHHICMYTFISQVLFIGNFNFISVVSTFCWDLHRAILVISCITLLFCTTNLCFLCFLFS